MEPESIFLEMAAHIFGVDIDLFIFDGVLDGENDLEEFNFGKLNIKGDLNDNNNKKNLDESDLDFIPGKIRLIYNFESYSIFYEYDEVLKNKEIFKDLIDEKSLGDYRIEDYDDCLLCKEKLNGYETSSFTNIRKSTNNLNFVKENYSQNTNSQINSNNNLENKFLNKYNNQKQIMFHKHKLSCCYDCLRDYSKIFLRERVNKYLKDGCLSRECKKNLAY